MNEKGEHRETPLDRHEFVKLGGLGAAAAVTVGAIGCGPNGGSPEGGSAGESAAARGSA